MVVVVVIGDVAGSVAWNWRMGRRIPKSIVMIRDRQQQRTIHSPPPARRLWGVAVTGEF